MTLHYRYMRDGWCDDQARGSSHRAGLFRPCLQRSPIPGLQGSLRLPHATHSPFLFLARSISGTSVPSTAEARFAG